MWNGTNFKNNSFQPYSLISDIKKSITKNLLYQNALSTLRKKWDCIIHSKWLSWVHVSLLKKDILYVSQQWGSTVNCHCAYYSALCSSSPCSASFLPASCVCPEHRLCYTTADPHCKLHSKQIATKDILDWRQSIANTREVVQMFRARTEAH